MTRKNFYAIAMMIISMMISGNANAQGRGHEMNRHHGMNREMVMDRNGRFGMREGRHEAYHHDMMHHPSTPRLDHRGYVHGWEGRVRHDNGRWGYFRDNRWYWYDRYFEPDYYYAHPIGHFHAYHTPVAAKVVAGVAGAVVLGSIISALAH